MVVYTCKTVTPPNGRLVVPENKLVHATKLTSGAVGLDISRLWNNLEQPTKSWFNSLNSSKMISSQVSVRIFGSGSSWAESLVTDGNRWRRWSWGAGGVEAQNQDRILQKVRYGKRIVTYSNNYYKMSMHTNCIIFISCFWAGHRLYETGLVKTKCSWDHWS